MPCKQSQMASYPLGNLQKASGWQIKLVAATSEDLLSSYFVPGTVLNTFDLLTNLIPIITQ